MDKYKKRKIKQTVPKSTKIAHTILMGGVFLWIFPLAYMIFSSLKPNGEVLATFWPTRFTFENYTQFLTGGVSNRSVLRAIFNSLYIAITQTIVFVGVSAISGYAITKLQIFGKRFWNGFILYQMLVPSLITLIPMFFVVQALGLYNSYMGMIVYALIGAQGVFLYSQFFKTIPNEMIESARMDGAGELLIIFRIMIPLALPITAFVATFQFMGRWEEFLWNFIVVIDDEYKTLPVVLSSFIFGGYDNLPGLKMAGSTILTLPILIMFFCMRKFYVKGISTGALKG